MKSLTEFINENLEESTTTVQETDWRVEENDNQETVVENAEEK